VARFNTKDGKLNKYNLWENCLIVTSFLKYNLVREVGLFNEDIGPGTDSIFGAGEDYDYILRSLNKGFKIYYSPSICVYHDQIFNFDFYGEKDLKKNYIYSVGSGRLLGIYYPKFYILYMFLIKFRAILTSILFIKYKKVRMLWHAFCGMFIGYVSAVRDSARLEQD
jgi:GT2 family glycosyltransferase